MSLVSPKTNLGSFYPSKLDEGRDYTIMNSHLQLYPLWQLHFQQKLFMLLAP